MKDLPQRPWTYAISDGTLSPDSFAAQLTVFLERLRELVEAGVSMFQIREKQLSGSDLYELSHSAAAIIRRSSTLLFVNDRADVAMASGADGVHLTGRSIPAADVRRCFGKSLRIAVSTHDIHGVETAARSGADLAVYGPVFTTPAKGPSVGLSGLAAACLAAADMPILALGGINEANVGSVLSSGTAGAAGIRGFGSPRQMRDLRHQMTSHER